MSLKYNLKLSLFTSIACGSLLLTNPTFVFSAGRKDTGKLICEKKGSLAVRDKCKKGETELTPQNFASIVSLPPPICEAGEVGDSGPPGAPGADGPMGDAGDKGTAGEKGINPFGILPSGRTYVGSFFKSITRECEARSRIPVIQVAFPARAPVAPDAAKTVISRNGHSPGVCGGNIVNCSNESQIAKGDVCKGSVSNPTAPPGYVCIYFTQFNEDESFALGTNTGMGEFGFVFSWIFKDTASSCNVEGVWAYTP